MENTAWESEIVEDGGFKKLLCKLLTTIINSSEEPVDYLVKISLKTFEEIWQP